MSTVDSEKSTLVSVDDKQQLQKKTIIDKHQELPKHGVIASIPSTITFQNDCQIESMGIDIEVDMHSQMGHFGWPEDHDDRYYEIPYILRNSEKYFSTRMMSMKEPLRKYLVCLHPKVYSYYKSITFCATKAECHLLNEINYKHWIAKFGKDVFTTKSLIVKADDAYLFCEYLTTCFNMLHFGAVTTNKIGFIKLNEVSVVSLNNKRFSPLACFENTNNLEIEYLSGWDLQYLYFCCMYQGIWTKSHDVLPVVSLNNILDNLPEDTQFYIYWPRNINHDLLSRADLNPKHKIKKMAGSSNMKRNKDVRAKLQPMLRVLPKNQPIERPQ